MTNAEAERIVKRIRESGQWKVEQEEAFAAERAWVKQAFMSAPIGEDEEHDRHPQFVRRCELQAGDTTELDNFLAGFSTK